LESRTRERTAATLQNQQVAGQDRGGGRGVTQKKKVVVKAAHEIGKKTRYLANRFVKIKRVEEEMTETGGGAKNLSREK